MRREALYMLATITRRVRARMAREADHVQHRLYHPIPERSTPSERDRDTWPRRYRVQKAIGFAEAKILTNSEKVRRGADSWDKTGIGGGD